MSILFGYHWVHTLVRPHALQVLEKKIEIKLPKN